MLVTTQLARNVPRTALRAAVGSRGFASEKEMRDRIAATTNIAKITKSMKMVAAARMRKDEEALAAGKPFGGMFARTMMAPEGFEAPEGTPEPAAKEGPTKHLVVVNSSDRGLCGGINSGVARYCRELCDKLEKQGAEVSVACVGDKARGQMQRTHGELFQYMADDHQKNLTFAQVCTFSERIVGLEWDEATIVHNHYVSMIAYEQVEIGTKNLTPATDDGPQPDLCPPHLLGYEFEPEDKSEALNNLSEFAFAGSLYGAIIDGNAAEQSARMQAMENASKNAEEMIEKLTISYNRLRQARITTELIEIISGANALEGGED